MDAQLKKGLLNICILQFLKQSDLYGYEIVKRIQKYFADTDESTVYAVLRRLHKEGLTDLYYSMQSNGPKRKYYRLTENGEKALSGYLKSIQEMEAMFLEIGIKKNVCDGERNL